MKLVLILLFIFLANPTATHAIAKAAYIAGVKPWAKEDSGE
jgi:multicomponent Na+:H+ antiporter subunit G